MGSAAWPAAEELTTVAERSGFLETGRYEEVIELCSAFEETYPEAVRCTEFGRTPEGRPMLALIASRTGDLTAEEAHRRGLPVLLAQGGIHAGEIDGKDAGFWVLREALEGRVAQGALDEQVFVFVPVFNVDGHERFGPWNRPNQNGPEEMGWRTTAENLNLNRDYAKAEAPEMQAMLRLVEKWDPILTVDLHVTDGAKFEHDVSIQVEPVNSGDAELRPAGRALRDDLIARLAERGSLPLPFYPSFVRYDDPSSGFVDGVSPPRFSTGYFTLRNRFGMLVETHSWKDYPTRVRVTKNAVIAALALTAERGRQWMELAHQADARARELGGERLPLTYEASDEVRTVEFRGYAYTRTPSEISGALMTRYDDSRPEIWKIPLRDDVRPGETVVAPTGGYLVPAAHADWIGERLSVHGIEFETLTEGRDEAAVQTFRATRTEFAPRPFEGHTRLTLEGAWSEEKLALAPGSLYVPIAQPKARLIVALFEPRAPDSYAAWGYFNGAFERKEYMEPYVAEEVAREMLAEDPALAREFERRLDEDPEFARDPGARLDFFYRRHSSWDERFNLYPIYRTAAAP